MAKKNRKKAANPQQKALLRKAFCAMAMLVGLYYMQSGLIMMKDNQIRAQTPRAEIEIRLGEVQAIKPSLEDFCRNNPDCHDSQKPDAFLYETSEQIKVVRPEEANAVLLTQALQNKPIEVIPSAAAAVVEEPQSAETKLQPAPIEEAQPVSESIKELVRQAISFDLPAQNDLFANIEGNNQEILDRIYEEELPDDVIDENPDSEFTHINHTKIKDLKIVPSKKPLYFGEEPVIAIVIDDMGVSQRRTADIISLQAPLTSSFLTYSNNLNRQIEKSRQAGHEIMIHVPMEAQKVIDTAPDVLTTKMNNEELRNNFSKMLDKFHGIKGINNHMGSKLTEDEARMEVIMSVLKAKNLFFLDSKTSGKSRAEPAAKHQQVAYGHRHVFLDNNNDKEYILKQLELTERLARKNGYAVAIGHPKSQMYAALKEWLATLPEKKIKLVHLSEIMTVLNPQVVITALK